MQKIGSGLYDFDENYPIWFFARTLIWYYIHKHAHTKTQHNQEPVD